MSASAPQRQTGSADWVFARLPRKRRDVVLDVGIGLAGHALAAEVRQVIVVGRDAAQLQTRRAEATAAGIENAMYLRGDAAALPFLAASFRMVLCGFALHHFDHPSRELTEIKRVLEPGGWLGLADMVVSEDPGVAELQNRIELLRDSSHVGALSASKLQDTVVRLGYEVAGAETHEVRRPLEAWLAETRPPLEAAAELRGLVRADVDGGAPTGLAPRAEDDDSVSIVHTLTSLLVLNRDA